MAEYIRLNEESEYHGMPIDDGKNSHIQILCDEDFGLNNFNDKEIREAKNVTVLEIPAFRGGGGGGFPSLVHMIFTALSITFIVVSKGFFSEIGKDLAQSLLKKFKSKKQPCNIYVSVPDSEIHLLVPADMSEQDCLALADKLNAFITTLNSERGSKIYLFYDKEMEKLIVVSSF